MFKLFLDRSVALEQSHISKTKVGTELMEKMTEKDNLRPGIGGPQVLLLKKECIKKKKKRRSVS